MKKKNTVPNTDSQPVNSHIPQDNLDKNTMMTSHPKAAMMKSAKKSAGKQMTNC